MGKIRNVCIGLAVVLEAGVLVLEVEVVLAVGRAEDDESTNRLVSVVLAADRDDDNPDRFSVVNHHGVVVANPCRPSKKGFRHLNHRKLKLVLMLA
mmetsp:Transcript_2063/g.3739  ORF Transcript_2063/g.3739 Transcript_2063/m.3739 type:complete len:96 (-) Transcript_2063:99-386(-)